MRLPVYTYDDFAPEKCKVELRSGYSMDADIWQCGNKACEDGYCKRHSPKAKE